jgi:hypothetical protein
MHDGDLVDFLDPTSPNVVSNRQPILPRTSILGEKKHCFPVQQLSHSNAEITGCHRAHSIPTSSLSSPHFYFCHSWVTRGGRNGVKVAGTSRSHRPRRPPGAGDLMCGGARDPIGGGVGDPCT